MITPVKGTCVAEGGAGGRLKSWHFAGPMLQHQPGACSHTQIHSFELWSSSFSPGRWCQGCTCATGEAGAILRDSELTAGLGQVTAAGSGPATAAAAASSGQAREAVETPLAAAAGSGQVREVGVTATAVAAMAKAAVVTVVVGSTAAACARWIGC